MFSIWELCPGPMRGGFSRYISTGPWKTRRGLWNSEGPRIALTIDVLFWFFLFSWVVFIYKHNFVKFTYTFEFWLLIITHIYNLHCNKEGHHFIIYMTYIYVSSACPRDPKSVLFRLAKFLFEALIMPDCVHFIFLSCFLLSYDLNLFF